MKAAVGLVVLEARGRRARQRRRRGARRFVRREPEALVSITRTAVPLDELRAAVLAPLIHVQTLLAEGGADLGRAVRLPQNLEALIPVARVALPLHDRRPVRVVPLKDI